MIRTLLLLLVISATGRFDAHAYHDFLLSQGLLPFDLYAIAGASASSTRRSSPCFV